MRVELWNGDELVHDEPAADQAASNAAIDRIITEVHQGEHGEGDFTLLSYREVNGLFAGECFSGKLSHPRRPEVARTPALHA